MHISIELGGGGAESLDMSWGKQGDLDMRVILDR